jgi:diguanylate cyclase (GGDEF)-like protein
MGTWFFRILLACAAALLAATTACAQDIDLRAGQDEYLPRFALRYWVDERGEATLDQARQALTEGKLMRVSEGRATFGFAHGAYWFHLTVANRDHPVPDWVLSIAYALLDHVQLFVVRPDGLVERFESGDRVPFAWRALDHRHPTMPFHLAPGDSAELWLRVVSQSSIQVPLDIITREAFLARTAKEYIGLGLYYGILLGLFCYNLILFLSIRDMAYLHYVLYVAAFGIGQLCLNGLAFQYLWPTAPDWANTAVLVFIGLGLITMLQFTRSFLNLAKLWPGVDRIALVLIAILAAAMLAIPLLGYRRTILIETGMVFFVATVILAAAVRVWREGYRPARNFLLAWVALLAGIVVYAAVSFGLLPKTFVTEYGIQFGSAAEMILLSFALAYRINMLQEENARIQDESREQLELRVTERTQELAHAMQQLKVANAALRDQGMRDGLTGTYNRRYLDQYLVECWVDACRSNRTLSLLMIDLDHFKQINDRHGHLAGDDCLTAVAQILLRHCRLDRDRVIRYGGEEFILVLPDCDARTALDRAHTVHAAVGALRIRHGEAAMITLSISVGVASFAADPQRQATDLVRVVDQALYEAKRAGRDRVALAEDTARDQLVDQ